jgi:hypothetical protein
MTDVGDHGAVQLPRDREFNTTFSAVASAKSFNTTAAERLVTLALPISTRP